MACVAKPKKARIRDSLNSKVWKRLGISSDDRQMESPKNWSIKSIGILAENEDDLQDFSRQAKMAGKPFPAEDSEVDNDVDR